MLTLILKSLNACNLRCSYCSVGSKEHAKALSEEQMRDALAFFAGYAHLKGEQQVSVIFHGGEPMLLPASQYGHCIEAVTESFPEITFQFCMQTNGTLLSAEYIELFQQYGIHVGVSLDGSQKIHDGQRRNVSGAETYALVMQNIHAMQEQGLGVAALMVLTKPALSGNLIFLQDFDRLDLPLKINPLLSLGDAVRHPELGLEPGDYGRYLVRVFEYSAKQRLRLPISPLDEMCFNLLNEGENRGCQFSVHCHNSFLCIDPEGLIYPCGRFADTHEYAIGSIEEGITAKGQSILEALEARRTTRLPEKCRTCRHVRLCHAGCSADQLLKWEVERPCTMCEDYRYFFHYLKTQGVELLKQQLSQERVDLLAHMTEIGAVSDGI